MESNWCVQLGRVCEEKTLVGLGFGACQLAGCNQANKLNAEIWESHWLSINPSRDTVRHSKSPTIALRREHILVYRLHLQGTSAVQSFLFVTHIFNSASLSPLHTETKCQGQGDIRSGRRLGKFSLVTDFRSQATMDRESRKVPMPWYGRLEPDRHYQVLWCSRSALGRFNGLEWARKQPHSFLEKRGQLRSNHFGSQKLSPHTTLHHLPCLSAQPNRACSLCRRMVF